MKLRTSVKLAVVITVGVFLAYGAALFYMDRTMAHLAREVSNANELSSKISLLRTLSMDNLVYQTERSRRQWTAVYDEVRHLLVDKLFLDLQLEYGLGDLSDKVKIVGDTFQKLLTVPGGERPDDPETEVARQLRNRLTTQLMLTTQDLLNRFVSLREEVNERLSRTQRLISLLNILALLSLGLIILSAGVFLQRSVLKPVLRLHEGAEIIGAGNLDYKVGMGTKDELGELSRTFDRMIDNLQKVTVSRNELVREMAERQRAEAALGESEARYRLLHETLRDAFVQVSMDGRIVECNDIFCQMLGYLPEEIHRLTYQQVTPARWHAFEADLVRDQIIARGYSDVYEKEYQRQDGTIIPVELRTILSRDAAGQPAGMWAIVRDITERKRAEAELERIREQMAEGQRIAHLGSWEYIAGTQTTVWSDEQKRIYGLDPAQPSPDYEMMMRRHIHPDDAAGLDRSFRQASKHGALFENENRIIRPDGTVRWIYNKAQPYFDEHGKLLRYVGATLDITERKEAEAALRESEERLRLLGDNLPDSAVYQYVHESDGSVRFLHISAGVERINGVRVQEVLDDPKALHGQILPEYYEQLVAAEARSARDLSDFAMEVPMRRPDGQVRWIQLQSRPRRLPDEGTIWDGVQTDITERRRAEEALRESEAKYRNLFENMTEEVHFWQLVRDESGSIKTWRLVDANPPTLKSWGRTRLDEVKGKTTDEIFGPGATEHYLPVVQKIMTDGAPYSFEDYFPHLDKYFRFTSVPLGEYFITTGADITSAKKAEQKLRESREDLNRAQAVAHTGSWRLDVRKNELTWSEENHRIFGIPQGTSLTYEIFLGTIHPEDREYVDREWSAALSGKPYDIEHRIVVDGAVKWVRERAGLEFDQEGRLLGGFGTTQDITERKQAEEALIRAKEEWERTFDAVSDYIALLDKEHRITRMNKAMGELLGKAAEGAIGQPCFKAVHGLADAPDFCPHAKVLSTGQTQSTEVLEFDRTFAVSVSPIFAPDGQLIGGVHVARDITESKRAQEALEARSAELFRAVSELEETNAEMERFTYMISHDLKSPLVTISTFLGYLEEDLRQNDAERIDKDIYFMATATEKMGHLLDELLEMSRIGRVVNASVEITFQELAREVLQALAGPIAARGVAVQTGSDDITLFGDRSRLMEIWQNLIENAVKYMGEQANPHLSLGLEQQGDETVFTVSDNGMGIDPKFQGKIFGLFEKLDSKTGGTGIGLAIVKRIVELYQGKIWVESAGLGHGACFRFTLPGAVKRANSEIAKSE